MHTPLARLVTRMRREKKLIETVWNALYDKVPRQTNRLVIDLSEHAAHF